MTEKALVLGGGGVTGVAWEIGILAGLAEHGADVSDADLVVGTSAGSVVGVDIRSGASLADFYQVQLAPTEGEIKAKLGVTVVLKYARAMAFTKDPAVARAKIGAMALRTKTQPEAGRRAVIESGIPIREWPAARLAITAVDAATGEFRAFDATSGVSLVDAVGASCAVPGVWPPVTIDGRRYIDGGMRSATNADLAAGYQRVVVIAPITASFGTMASLGSQVRKLTEQGAEVLVIKPDRAAVRAIGRNMLDPARRAAAARAGLAQAADEARAVAALWSQTPAERPEPADRE
jgi:NTE family protein